MKQFLTLNIYTTTVSVCAGSVGRSGVLPKAWAGVFKNKHQSMEKKKLPEAHIAVAKNRCRTYSWSNGDKTETRVYLDSGTDYQIELFNPLEQPVSASIELDGQLQGSNIVIRPGERVYLDRHIGTARKLTYRTYQADDSPEADSAIINNGKVLVNFYETLSIPPRTQPGIAIPPRTQPGIAQYPTWQQPTWQYPSTSPTPFDPTWTVYQSGCVAIGSPTNQFTSINNITGRTEQGGQSDQQINDYLGGEVFCPVPTHSTEYWIRPAVPGWPPPEKYQDLPKYCCECGARIRKSNWKYCPSCGTKI